MAQANMTVSYTPQVLDHAQNPRNVGQIPDADGTGQSGDPRCGDFAVMTIRVRNGRIAQCKFLVQGCGAAIATCSVTTELASDKTIAEAQLLSDERVAEALGGLPPHKMHCSNLAASALHAAITSYLDRQKISLRDWRSLYTRK